MAISLFCYSSGLPNDVERSIRLLNANHANLFKEEFLISEITDLRTPANYYDSVAVEVALEHNFHAACLFLVSLNIKSAANSIPLVVDALKKNLGTENLLILLNNEHEF